jgi:GH15 family glucan-1,4-alpha-glucosidase
MTDYGLDLAVVGNGRTAALVDPSARIVWWCLPHYDGDPVFCRLIAGDEEKGFTDVVLDRMVETSSDYVRNTAIVATELTDDGGNAVRITSFAPRARGYRQTVMVCGAESYSDAWHATVICGERSLVRAHPAGAHGVRYR